MLKNRQLLGRDSWQIGDYFIKLSFGWNDEKYDLHIKYKLASDGNVGTETIITSREVKTNYIYLNNPSLVDRLLGRADKKAVGTNAKPFIRSSLQKAKNRIKEIERSRGIEFDEEAFDAEIEEKVFPLSDWADIKNSTMEVNS